MTYPESHENQGNRLLLSLHYPQRMQSLIRLTRFFWTQKVLAKIGVKVNIESDVNLLSKLNTAYDSGIQVWASARGSAGFNPDMFPIWYSDSGVNGSIAPSATGLFYLFENGSDEQKSMLTELNKLILRGATRLIGKNANPYTKRP